MKSIKVKAVYYKSKAGDWKFVAAFAENQLPEFPSDWPLEICEWLQRDFQIATVVLCEIHRLKFGESGGLPVGYCMTCGGKVPELNLNQHYCRETCRREGWKHHHPGQSEPDWEQPPVPNARKDEHGNWRLGLR